MKDSVIHFDHVSFAYQDQSVLEKVSLEIFNAEKIAIIGPNGGGKTTFLHLIMGFLRPERGKISLFGAPPKEKRHRIGYVPQRLFFDVQFPISTYEVVLMGALQKTTWYGAYPSAIKKKALEFLERFGLSPFKSKRFGTLSGGQMQRCLIARSLMSDPDILLLDEATSSIDPHAEKTIYDFIKEFVKNKTLIMVTHELDALTKDIDRVLSIEKTISIYKPDEICEHFARGLYHKPLMPKEGPR